MRDKQLICYMIQYGIKTQKIYKTINTIYNGDSSCLLILLFPLFISFSKSLYTLHTGVNFTRVTTRVINNDCFSKQVIIRSVILSKGQYFFQSYVQRSKSALLDQYQVIIRSVF